MVHIIINYEFIRKVIIALNCPRSQKKKTTNLVADSKALNVMRLANVARIIKKNKRKL